MNLSPAWVTVLAEAGHEALHWSTVGEAGAPQAPSPRLLRGVLLSALARFEKDLLDGALVSVDENRFRARVLPLRRRAR